MPVTPKVALRVQIRAVEDIGTKTRLTFMRSGGPMGWGIHGEPRPPELGAHGGLEPGRSAGFRPGALNPAPGRSGTHHEDQIPKGTT